MLPMNNLLFGELLSSDALSSGEASLGEGMEALHGTFADILKLRQNRDLDLRSDDGDVLPQAGNSVPLLPPLPAQTEELSIVATIVATIDGQKTSNWALVNTRPTDYLDSSTIHKAVADLKVITPLNPHTSHNLLNPLNAGNPQISVDVKPVVRAIDPVARVPEPEIASALPTKPQVTPIVPPTTQSTPLPASAAEVLTGESVESEPTRLSGKQPRALPTKADVPAETLNTALPRILSARTQEVATPRPAVRRVLDAGTMTIDTTDIDPELPPPRTDARTPSNAYETLTVSREDVQAITRTLANSTHQPGPVNVETPAASDTGVRLVADTTPTAPRQPEAAPSSQAKLYTIDLPVQESGWDKAISERVLLIANGKLQNAEIRLSPADLGPLRVQVAIDDGTANVSFQAQHALTREAIELAMPRLREMLAENGLSLGQTNVGDDGVQHGSRDNAESARPQSGVAADKRDVEEHSEQRLFTSVDDGLVDTFA